MWCIEKSTNKTLKMSSVINSLFAGVCVLTGPRTEKYDQIMRWQDSRPQSGISQLLYSAAYFYVSINLCP